MQSPQAETLDDVRENYSLAELLPEPQLVVALEGDRPLAGGARYSLSGVHEVIIGRGSERSAQRSTRDGLTTLTLRLPARSLSTLHARVVRAGEQWILEDAQSRNGSFMDGKQVQRAAWGDQSVVQLGHVFLLLRGASLVAEDTPSRLDASELASQPSGLRTLLPHLRQSFEGLVRVARSGVPILLLGETGTGKELVARAIHQLAERGPAFVAVSCGSLSDAQVEAQLFGSSPRDVPTGSGPELGFLRSADRGTLFLDEIGDLRAPAQAALLRALEHGEVIALGTSSPTQVDLLVISATHRELARPADALGLRQDLVARLGGYTLCLPPLRERLEDLGVMVADILQGSGVEGATSIRLSASAGTALFLYDWPANARELQHVLLSAAALSRDGIIHLSHLPAALAKAVPRRDSAPEPPPEPEAALTDEERRLRAAVLQQLREHQGNVAAVGRAMRKAPMQVHRWMKRFGIDPLAFRSGAKK